MKSTVLYLVLFQKSQYVLVMQRHKELEEERKKASRFPILELSNHRFDPMPCLCTLAFGSDRLLGVIRVRICNAERESRGSEAL